MAQWQESKHLHQYGMDRTCWLCAQPLHCMPDAIAAATIEANNANTPNRNSIMDNTKAERQTHRYWLHYLPLATGRAITAGKLWQSLPRLCQFALVHQWTGTSSTQYSYAVQCSVSCIWNHISAKSSIVSTGHWGDIAQEMNRSHGQAIYHSQVGWSKDWAIYVLASMACAQPTSYTECKVKGT